VHLFACRACCARVGTDESPDQKQFGRSHRSLATVTIYSNLSIVCMCVPSLHTFRILFSFLIVFVSLLHHYVIMFVYTCTASTCMGHVACVSHAYIFPLCSRAAEKAFASKIRATEQDYNGKIADLTGRVRPEVAITHARSYTYKITYTHMCSANRMYVSTRTHRPTVFASSPLCTSSRYMRDASG